MLNEKHLMLFNCTKYVLNIHLDLWMLYIDLDEMNIMSEDRKIKDKNQ